MKKYLILILFLVFIFSAGFSGERDDLLKKFVARVEQVKDISFNYKSGAAEGVVSISKEAIYLSQKNKLEIYETAGVRYTYNKRRSKVDIDSVGVGNNVSSLMQWTGQVDRYRVTKRESGDGGVIYKLTGGAPENELIELTFGVSGDVQNMVYQSRSVKRLVVSVSGFVFGGKPTASYFTFNPEQRRDLEITDYR